MEIPEWFFRAVVALLLMLALGRSMWCRHRADRSGGGISRARDGVALAVSLTAFGVAGAVAILAWLIKPATIEFAALGLPAWARLAGTLAAAACLPLFEWMLRHLGPNVTATSMVRESATLITTGPYQYLRHPMYAFGLLFYLGLSAAMDTWLVAAIVSGAFLLIALRTRREEANLAARFGAEYEAYRERTGRFIPKFGRAGPCIGKSPGPSPQVRRGRA